ncbi:insulinase family protein [Waterburya agarophytonicola K14]|uniref:Insulinase family protein n=1 Tax=Waterburya agarophytonicola KI4 TaxID=2874699 RepID=A0A964FFR5_9CYAN|nr:pitrilysin family protein [Waterburya agarophytonicola]MCC0177251.1 insulinase family protein [Waterburya agarophytonicola KI4]
MSPNSTITIPNLHRLVLDNGITLIIVENQAADIISGRFFFKGAGTIVEKPEQAGLAHLVSAVIAKGTEKLSALEIAEKIESIGAGLGADASTDYFALSLKTVSADFPEMLRLLGAIMRSPVFPESEVELERKLTLQGIKSQTEQPFNVAFNQLRQQMYPQHPYGVSVLGTETSVVSLTRADLQHYHQTYFRPDSLVISLSGRITQKQGIELISGVFGDWQNPDLPLPVSELVSPVVNPSEAEIIQDTQQSIVMLGYLGTKVDSPDYAVLKLISTYLGNGLSSRLFVELREKRGLAYDVSAFFPTRLETAPFVTYMGTAPSNTEIAIEGLSREVERLTKINLSESELQGVKNKLLGQYALGKQTNGEIAQTYGWYETLGLGVDFDNNFQAAIPPITPDLINEVANRYLSQPYLSLVKREK